MATLEWAWQVRRLHQLRSIHIRHTYTSIVEKLLYLIIVVDIIHYTRLPTSENEMHCTLAKTMTMAADKNKTPAGTDLAPQYKGSGNRSIRVQHLSSYYTDLWALTLLVCGY